MNKFDKLYNQFTNLEGMYREVRMEDESRLDFVFRLLNTDKVKPDVNRTDKLKIKIDTLEKTSNEKYSEVMEIVDLLDVIVKDMSGVNKVLDTDVYSVINDDLTMGLECIRTIIMDESVVRRISKEQLTELFGVSQEITLPLASPMKTKGDLPKVVLDGNTMIKEVSKHSVWIGNLLDLVSFKNQLPNDDNKFKAIAALATKKILPLNTYWQFVNFKDNEKAHYQKIYYDAKNDRGEYFWITAVQEESNYTKAKHDVFKVVV